MLLAAERELLCGMGTLPSMVLHDLWQGGMDVLHDEEWFKEQNIRYVMSLGMHEPAFEIKEGLAGHLSIVLEGAVSCCGQGRRARTWQLKRAHYHRPLINTRTPSTCGHHAAPHVV